VLGVSPNVLNFTYFTAAVCFVTCFRPDKFGLIAACLLLIDGIMMSIRTEACWRNLHLVSSASGMLTCRESTALTVLLWIGMVFFGILLGFPEKY